MAMAAGGLTEPHVLAHTKRRLFPDGAENTYAVTDTQFARESWLSDQPIDAAIKDRLAPFNHVRVGSGYPDLVGVRPADDDIVAVDRLGNQPPLVAVEAKGTTGHGVDVERGVIQAHDRLDEANLAFVAAPATAITQSAATLARELNVGVLGVADDGAVHVRERPRVVGNRTTSEATAIRFQASAQGVANKSFGLNHPKNYLAYPLALAHDGATDAVLEDRVVAAVDDARRGATFLDLVEETPRSDRLTELGREVVRFALAEYGSVDAALDEFANWKRSRVRFRDEAPRWGLLARRVVYAYPATEFLVSELQTMHDDGISEPSLVDLVTYLHALHPTFTIELFIRGTGDAREAVLTEDGELNHESLTNGARYHSPTVFQLKAMLYHAGILTERGAEPHRLTPTQDVWALREPVSPMRRES